jgi:sec-independent protein translocase protein TatA
MIHPIFIGPVGPMETVLLVMAIVLLFGADKIPKLAESMGEAKAKLKQGQKKAEEEMEEIEDEVNSE